MSTWVSLTVDGLTIEDFQNGYNSWFFKKSDRVREVYPRDEEGMVSENEFIGYRALGASIKRRMTLAGYDIEACKVHFHECRDEIISALEHFFSLEGSSHFADDSQDNEVGKCWKYYLNAVKQSEFEDWISLLPQAVKLEKQRREAGYNVYSAPRLAIVSPAPLVNAMLSNFDFATNYVLTGPMNFPCFDSSHFVTALLAACPEDMIFELNIEPLIRSGYVEDFTDLDEIQQKETQPHSFCRQSIEETVTLSATHPENLPLQRMCYSSIITAMEAYLGDILKREIFSRSTVKERFVASYEPFRKTKFSLAELYTKLSTIDGEITEVLDGLSLHKMDAAKDIFSKTLLTEFPPDSVRQIGAAVKQRHHIVHRNGRDTQGNLLSIDFQTVHELADEVRRFTQNVDAQILDGLLAESCVD